MVDNLPEFLSYSEEPTFDPEEFYWNKIVPFRDVFQSSPRYNMPMVNNILEKDVKGELNDIGRTRRILTQSNPYSKKKDHSSLINALEDDIQNSPDETDFSTWYEEFCNNIIPFSKSRDFRTYSITTTPPLKSSNTSEPLDLIAESASTYFTDNKLNILGSSHYAMTVDKKGFKDEYGMTPSRLADGGYIGREQVGPNMRIFINDSLVKRIISTDPDSNPYTPR